MRRKSAINPADGTLAQCEKLGILPMAWSPLAGGKLFDPKNDAAPRISAAVEKMSARYNGATIEQLAYAWIMAHPSQPLPIIGKLLGWAPGTLALMSARYGHFSVEEMRSALTSVERPKASSGEISAGSPQNPPKSGTAKEERVQ